MAIIFLCQQFSPLCQIREAAGICPPTNIVAWRLPFQFLPPEALDGVISSFAAANRWPLKSTSQTHRTLKSRATYSFDDNKDAAYSPSSPSSRCCAELFRRIQRCYCAALHYHRPWCGREYVKNICKWRNFQSYKERC
ncbi:hypothetical protein ABFS83_04G134600 [Erythranthe nasuta]